MPPVTLARLGQVFLRLGATAFGGSILPLIEEEVVQRRRWLREESFAEGVALAQLVPGPVALKVASYVGGIVRGWPGALLAVVCFTLPSFLFMALAGMLLFHSLTPAALSRPLAVVGPVVVGLLLLAAWRLARPCVTRPMDALLAGLALLAVRVGWSPLVVLWGLGLLNVVREGTCRSGR